MGYAFEKHALPAFSNALGLWNNESLSSKMSHITGPDSVRSHTEFFSGPQKGL